MGALFIYQCRESKIYKSNSKNRILSKMININIVNNMLVVSC